MKSALGQISGCLGTAWTVLGHVLGQAWFGFLACPEAARRVLGDNRGEGEAMLDAAWMALGSNGGQREALLHAFPDCFFGEQIQGENPCQSDSVRHEFLLEFVYHTSTAAQQSFAWGAVLAAHYCGPFLVFARLAGRAVLLMLGTGKPPRSPRFARLVLRPALLQLKTPWTADVVGLQHLST